MIPRFTKKVFFLFLMICVVFLVISAETLIANEHDCAGEGCPVCAYIEAVQCFLKTFRLAAIGMLWAIYSVFRVPIHKKYADCILFLSPISLKIRFNS
jgi:hypothetical protein